MTDILGAQPINEYGPLVTAISNPSATLIPIFMPDGTGAHASAQALLDKSNQTIVAYLTSGATAEWVNGAYAKATALHYTDPAKLVSGTYVAGSAVTAGVVPPASPWLLSALDGKDGVSAVSTITTTRPNVPAVGSDAIYSVGSAAGYGIGMYVDIINASATSLGTFLIVGITTASLTLRNVTAIATTTVSTGFTVVASGRPGTNGTNGTSAIATASTFAQPAVNANVTVTVSSSAGFVDKQPLFHSLGGYYKVSGAPPSATTVTLQNLGYAGNIAAAASVGAGTLVPSGLKGADASGSGHIIEVNGVAQTQRGKLNLVVTGATTTDDASGDRTVVNIPASGSGSAPVVQTFGNGTANLFTITHNKATRNVGVLVYKTASPNERVLVGVSTPTDNTVEISTSLVTPALNEYTAIVYVLASASGSTVSGGSAGGRVTLTADRTYYVRSTGLRTGLLASETDATTNTDADAFGTLALAANAMGALDLSIFQPTIQVQDGLYPKIPLVVTLGAKAPIINGNSSNVNNVTFAGFLIENIINPWTIQNCKIEQTADYASVDVVASRVNFGNINWGNTQGILVTAQKDSIVTFLTNFTMSGSGSDRGFTAVGTSLIYFTDNTTVTRLNTPAFPAGFVYAAENSFARVAFITFVGARGGLGVIEGPKGGQIQTAGSTNI
jgi:hypothetical protein